MELTTDQWFYAAIAGEQAMLIGVLIYALLTSRRPRSAPAGGTESHQPNRFLQWIAREPVRFRTYVATIVGAVTPFLAVWFGVDLSTEQVASIVGLVGTVGVAAAEMSRRAVSPVEDES